MYLLVKSIATSVAFFLFTHLCFAQNLIPNPGFEEYHSCPTGLRQLNAAKYWSGANAGSPELFHTCGFTADVKAHNGEGLAGVIFLSESSNNVEYLQVELLEELEPGEEYTLSFYIRLSRNSLIAINKIGAFLSSNGLHSKIWMRFSNRPQIVFNEVAESTLSWQKYEGKYVAKGGEKFITVGNFYQKHFIEEKIVKSSAGSRTTYYYLDDFFFGKQVMAQEKVTPRKPAEWSHTVYFQKDSSSISHVEIEKLVAFIQQLPQPMFHPIKVEGHTDQDASFEYNLQLSQQRANRVKERLGTFNFQNIYSTWLGESEIIYIGTKEEKKGMNRRVTITVER